MKLKDLESILQDVATFENPKVELEQYPTRPHIAARVLYTAETSFEDIEGKVVADFGCGTGVLSIGCSMLGASHVIGLDIDDDALTIARENANEYEDDLPIDFLKCNVKDVAKFHPKLRVNTVIMNPPFGTRDKHADVEFLNVAFSISNSAVYSLHKRSTRGYLEKLALRDARVGEAQVLAELRYDVHAMYKFHKKASKDIEVDLWRFSIVES
ncbi:hypothetical protein BSKO_03057 [Bryopsis sp. KO-2023]|nr:hypothetical protein BSKO_03057 [Bryopsis sp. KO-2023]